MTITVIVDDSDPEITYGYGDAWTETQPSALGFSGIKQSVGNTLHAVSGGPETSGFLSYNFSGSTISFFALMVPNIVNTSTVPYNWECFVDEVIALPLALQKTSEPTTIKICEFTELTDGPHQFSFSFNSDLTSDVIYFDYIEYLPTRYATPQTFSFIAVSFDDKAIIYDDDWRFGDLLDGSNSTGMITEVSNPSVPTVQLQFNGSSATWIGFLMPGHGAVATYTIDSEPRVQFALPQYSAGNNELTVSHPGRVYFETTQLATAPHNISLTYSPPNGTWQPMSVQSVIIGNGTVPALITNTTVVPSAPINTTVVPSAPTNTSSPLSTATKPQETTHRLRPGPIIAGALSGAFTIVFIIALVILHRRRGQTQRKHPHVIQAFNSQPSPLLARLITIPSVTTIDIKGRRRLLPAPVPPGVIPPSKLTPRPTDTTTQAPNEQDPVQPPTENAQAEGDVDNVRDLPVRVTRTRDIQEEDSGLRLVEQGADGKEEIIRVLPPVYTAI